MEDQQIIELYFQRDEAAIAESKIKYGAYCTTIAGNILHRTEDAEECVNDTWLRAWNVIPPQRPVRLAVFLGRITRNLAIDRYRHDRRQKNGGGQVPLCLEELSECVGEEHPITDRIALRELLQQFLTGLSEKQRTIFLLRYWYLLPVDEIAGRCCSSEGAVKMQLHRTRTKLRTFLEKEGFDI
ncbi:MAG: RNA polymerase sigma factor [Oscillospiraceae bacterium]|nr:RNA polymerase sigma factor [Oscillospiraceae bacterium]